MICSVREASIRSFKASATTRMSLSASAPDSSTTRLMSASMSVRLIASSTVPLLRFSASAMSPTVWSRRRVNVASCFISCA